MSHWDSCDAACELFNIAVSATEILDRLSEEKPELFSAIAGGEFAWPVLDRPQPEMMKKTAESLRRLGLSRETGINLSSGKSFRGGCRPTLLRCGFFDWRSASAWRRCGGWMPGQLRRIWVLSWSVRSDADSMARISWIRVASGDTAPDRAEIAEYQKQSEELDIGANGVQGNNFPPLSKETAAQWATATRELFRIC